MGYYRCPLFNCIMEDENSIKIASEFLVENDDKKKGVVSFRYTYVNLMLMNHNFT